jgi:hypothetical protein
MNFQASLGRLKPGARTLLAAALIATLAACSSVPSHKDAALFVSAPLSDAEIMPVIDEDRGNIKVVVVDAADTGDALSVQLKIGKQVTQGIEAMLNGRGMEIVDDALAPKLDDALRKAEALNSGKTAAYAGPKVAKYAIRPVVTSSTYSATYQRGGQVAAKNALVAAMLSSPTGYGHAASVNTTIRVYEMPTLRLLGTASGQGAASVTDPVQPANAATGGTLLKQAVASALQSASADLLNLLASKGYVVQRRYNPEGKISAYQVSMGTSDGLKAGDKIDIFTVRPADNAALKQAAPNEEIYVASGVVSGMLLGDATSWVVLDDEALAPKIRRGDLVKQKHERTFLNKLTEKVSGLAP